MKTVMAIAKWLGLVVALLFISVGFAVGLVIAPVRVGIEAAAEVFDKALSDATRRREKAREPS